MTKASKKKQQAARASKAKKQPESSRRDDKQHGEAPTDVEMPAAQPEPVRGGANQQHEGRAKPRR